MAAASPPEPDRRFLHADLDAFYASVEQRDNPELRDRPIIVGEGVVLASSYEARAKGVRTAMNGREAKRLCPEAIVVSPRMTAYSKASAAVFDVFRDTTPLVEGLSIDEAFLDVSGLLRTAGTPEQIAARLRERVRDEVGLPLSIGVASTKFLAKVASAAGKPDGLLAVPVGGEFEFLHPLPVRAIWGVGRVTESRLADKGVHTVGQLAAIDPGTLSSWLGRGAGAQLHALANNRDHRRVQTGKRRKSVGAQQALGRKPFLRSEAEVILLELVDRVSRRLRAGDRLARTVVLSWRGHDMSTHTRSSTLEHPSDSTATMADEGRWLLREGWEEIESLGLGLLGFTAANLTRSDAVQLGLDFSGRDRTELDSTVDAVRERWGTTSIGRGSHLGNDPFEMPMLPDDPGVD